MRFALEVRQGRVRPTEFAARLEEHIVALGGQVVSPEEVPEMVLAVGGDGTMLAAVARALFHDVPVLGFNLGTVGFLADAEPESAPDVIRRLLSGDYDVQERLTIKAAVDGEAANGVNDVVVEKVDSQRLVELNVDIDGKGFVTYRSDGVIVATPTGSTAYSFSAGGPLVTPSVDALILTPVAAHSLFDQSLVLDPATKIEIEVVRDRAVKVSVDKTDLGRLGEGGRVVVTAGDRRAQFVSLGETSFSQLVKTKFDLD